MLKGRILSHQNSPRTQTDPPAPHGTAAPALPQLPALTPRPLNSCQPHRAQGQDRDSQGTSMSLQTARESRRDAPCLKLGRRAQHHVLRTGTKHSYWDPQRWRASETERGHGRQMSCWQKRANSFKLPRSPQRQVATSVAVGGALNHFQFTCWCPSWNSICSLGMGNQRL